MHEKHTHTHTCYAHKQKCIANQVTRIHSSHVSLERLKKQETVSEASISDVTLRKPRGYSWVTFLEQSDTNKTILEFNLYELNGR